VGSGVGPELDLYFTPRKKRETLGEGGGEKEK